MIDEKLISEFVAQCVEIAAKASKIAELAENNFDVAPDALTWAHAGNNGHTIALLDEILEFLHLSVDPREYET